jgi:putative addiction module killer protein
MIELIQSDVYAMWIDAIRDRQTLARISARVRRLALGNPGQHRVLQGGICELKIDFGPGYRVYYTQIGARIVLLLCGGDKGSQQNDIAAALEIAANWKE